MLKNKTFIICTGFLMLLIFCSILAPLIAGHSYETQDLTHRLEGPSFAHLLGTDALGRDLLSRILFGGRLSLAIGVFTAFSALILGTLTGSLAGFYGGWIDRSLMRVVDFFYIFPSLLLAILLTIVFGRGFAGIFIAISITSWIYQARLVRGLVMQTKQRPFVEAANALGLRRPLILFKHILPQLTGPIIVSLSFQIPTNIMAESFLSFIGLGLQPPYSSWGTLANEGFRAMQSYPHLMIFPAVVLFLAMLAFQFLGDALADSTSQTQSTRL